MVGFQVRNLQTSRQKPLFSGAMLCIHKVWCLRSPPESYSRSVDSTPRKVKKESGDILPTRQRGHNLLVTFRRDFAIQQAGNVLTQLPFFILFGIFWGWTSPDFRRSHPNNDGLEGTGKASYIIYVISITLSDQWRSCSPASSQTLASSCFTLRHTFSNNHGSGKLPFDWKETRILEIHPFSTSIIMFSEGHMGLHGITSSYIVFIVFQDKYPVFETFHQFCKAKTPSRATWKNPCLAFLLAIKLVRSKGVGRQNCCEGVTQSGCVFAFTLTSGSEMRKSWGKTNTLPETNVAPENWAIPKGNHYSNIFQPSIFRCYVSFWDGSWRYPLVN